MSLLELALPDQLPDSPHPSFSELWRVTRNGNCKTSQLNASEAAIRETGSCTPHRSVSPTYGCVHFIQPGRICSQLCPTWKKKKKKPEMGFPGTERSLLINDVVPSFYLPPLHTGRSGGGEVSSPSDCIGNISQPAQGL